MARATLPPQADEAQAQAQDPAPAPAPAPAQASLSSSSMPVIALVLRLITLVSLILSTSLLASNSTTIRGYSDDTAVTDTLHSIRGYSDYTAITDTVHFNDIYAYRYALSTAVLGLAYTLLQLPFSIQQVTSGKFLAVNHAKLLVYEFVGDKVVLALLATGVGAAFGATIDLKTNLDELDDAIQVYLEITTLSPIRSKLDDFFNRAYIPAVFLLIAFLTTGVSSVLSSLALMKKTT